MVREWQCNTCGEWVSMAFMRHHHQREREVDVQTVILGRLHGVSLADVETETMTETWTPQHKTRDCPNG